MRMGIYVTSGWLNQVVYIAVLTRLPPSKAGDGVVDVQLIADLHKSEVFAVGRHLGVHEDILRAPPSADLWYESRLLMSSNP